MAALGRPMVKPARVARAATVALATALSATMMSATVLSTAAVAAVASVPAAQASGRGVGGPANCQLAMASPRAVGRSVTAVITVTCASPVELGLSGALWRARASGAQKMADSNQVFRRSTTARMSVTLACPGGTSSWVSTGNATYTVNGTAYLVGSISSRQRLAC